MHKLYKIISYFLIPFIKINTFIRILNKKEDKIRYKERFGYTNLQKPLGKELIWIHASSVGEFKSSDFLINSFFNNYNILITTTTKTAADYAITNHGDKIILGADVHNNKIAVTGWLETTDLDLFDFLEDYHAKGAVYVICTDISKDGLLQGSSNELYAEIMKRFPKIKLIA